MTASDIRIGRTYRTCHGTVRVEALWQNGGQALARIRVLSGHIPDVGSPYEQWAWALARTVTREVEEPVCVQLDLFEEVSRQCA